jgi:hypothetical protein
MLRKVSRQKVREQQPPLAPSSPPHLPSINKLPDLATFGGDDNDNDTRPDSVAIFNHTHSYTTSNSPVQNHPPRTANFSRLQQHNMAPSVVTSNNSSSPPGYVTRTGAAASRDSTSSPPARPSAVNGEYVADHPYGDRTESMTHRGRFSYASSSVNAVNSPRRVRRRRDPTPFK